MTKTGIGQHSTAPTLRSRILERLTLAVVLAAVAMFVFIKLAHEIGESETLRIDSAAMLYIHTHHNPLLFTVMTAVSWLAGPIFQAFVLIGCVLYFAATKRFQPQGATLLMGGIGGMALIVGLKHLFHRPRPSVIFQHLGYSFPSGHSFFAMIVYGMLAYWLTRQMPKRRRLLTWSLAAAGGLIAFESICDRSPHRQWTHTHPCIRAVGVFFFGHGGATDSKETQIVCARQ